MAFLTTVVAFSSAFYASRAGTIRCSEATAASTDLLVRQRRLTEPEGVVVPTARCCCAYNLARSRSSRRRAQRWWRGVEIAAAMKDLSLKAEGEKAERAATMAAMKLIDLKSEGAAVVEERAAMQAALKTKTLKLEGAKVAAARAEMMAALKAKTLAMEGAKVVAHRAAMADALKIKTLKLDGAKVVAHKAEMMEAYKSAEMELAKAKMASMAPAPSGFEWAGVY